MQNEIWHLHIFVKLRHNAILLIGLTVSHTNHELFIISLKTGDISTGQCVEIYMTILYMALDQAIL